MTTVSDIVRELRERAMKEDDGADEAAGAAMHAHRYASLVLTEEADHIEARHGATPAVDDELLREVADNTAVECIKQSARKGPWWDDHQHWVRTREAIIRDVRAKRGTK